MWIITYDNQAAKQSFCLFSESIEYPPIFSAMVHAVGQTLQLILFLSDLRNIWHIIKVSSENDVQ